MNQYNQVNAMNYLDYQVQGQNILSGTAGAGLSGTLTTSAAVGNATYTQGIVQGTGTTGGTLWSYWQDQYYPQVIIQSYPAYLQDKAMDKGKHAFELLKALMDKGLVKVDKVKDFIEAMDTILKTL